MAISIYPNPCNDEVTIKGIEFDSPYQIINALGQIIQTGKAFPNTSIKMNTISKGSYYLKINQQTIKLIKG